METQHFTHYSPALGRYMDCKIYGHAGRPVLFIPCQDGHAGDFEGFNMHHTWGPWLESGQVMVFSIDTIDLETWSNKAVDPFWRARRYEDWIRYITDELVPFMLITFVTVPGCPPVWTASLPKSDSPFQGAS